MEKREDFIQKLKSFFKDNAHKWHINLVFLYGSWAKGFPHQESDIDLAILFSNKIKDEEEILSLITDISYQLDQILNKEVNIISIDRNFSHPLLYYNAIVQGIPIFVKDEGEYIRLKMEAIFQKEDFSLFGVRWQLNLAERMLRR